MKKSVIALIVLAASSMATGGFAATQTLAPVSKDAQVAPPTQTWPVSFDTGSGHVKITFPVPSRELTQDEPSNHLYIAQLQAPDKNGVSLRQTFSLVYQQQPIFSVGGDTGTKAIELANQFQKSLSSHKGIVVKTLEVNHPAPSSTIDQHYRVLEVTDGAFTDYYIIRVMRTSDGAAVAIQTVQKDTRSPVDFNAAQWWTFVDSLGVQL